MMRLALVLAAGFAVQQAAATTCRATDARPLHESLRQNACHQLELEHRYALRRVSVFGARPITAPSPTCTCPCPSLHSARTGDVAALADVLPTATNLVDIEVEGVPLSGAGAEKFEGVFPRGMRSYGMTPHRVLRRLRGARRRICTAPPG